MTAPLCFREEVERRERDELSPLACFAADHHARPADEDLDPYRTAFVRDRDRVLHCGALRRLKDKTQVFVIGRGDFYRTRLTHTLEVTQMARFLARALRLNETLAEVLALVHDIGHPPFGHEGEDVLNLHSGVPFDHNRQALRIVDVLESPYHDRPGLNLTQIVRASILKHGGDAGHGAPDHEGAVLEAQVADLADSTAYQHHDLEDALRAGVLDEEELHELAIWRASARNVPRDLEPGLHIKAVLNDIVKTSLHDLVTSSAEALGQSSATSAVEIAADNARLIRMSPARAGMHRELGRFLLERFYQHPEVTLSREVATEALTLVVEHYTHEPEELPDTYRRRIADHGLGRVVCDYVAGMTDGFATEEWRRLGALQAAEPRPTWVPADTPREGLTLQDRAAILAGHIGYRFDDMALLEVALTHSSARGEHHEPNERLEFLGDAVLGVVIARHLFETFPDREEGEMSRIKSAVVSRHALRRVARAWGLADLLQVGGGILTAGEIPPSVIADAVEAILGAIFLDNGLPPVRAIIERDFGPLIEHAASRSRNTNHKSELQHFTQGELGFTPHYRVVDEEGPDHAKSFTVAAIVAGVELGEANGKNKRQAEQRAARSALNRLLVAQEDGSLEDLFGDAVAGGDALGCGEALGYGEALGGSEETEAGHDAGHDAEEGGRG